MTYTLFLPRHPDQDCSHSSQPSYSRSHPPPSPPPPEEKFLISVARYNESLQWVISFNDVAYIANKGNMEDDRMRPFRHVRHLPNVGKDQHSHLDFIVNMYDAIKDDEQLSMIVFCQGDVIDHQDVLSAPVKNEVEFMYRLLEDARHNPQGRWSYPGRINQGSFSPFPGMRVPGEHPTGVLFGRWFEEHVRRPFPRDQAPAGFRCYKNAIFAVHKSHVLSRPKAYYENLLAQFPAARSEAAHFMERSWWYALNCDKSNELELHFTR